jgi:hypothetical protein
MNAPYPQGQFAGGPTPPRRTAPPAQPPLPPAQFDPGSMREVRGVPRDDPEPRAVRMPIQAPKPVAIPSPEQLGVAPPPVARDSGLDWVGIRKQLHDLGVVSFQVEQTPDGGTHFVCHLATAEFGRTEAIEQQAATEAEAVRLVLARAEDWRRRN